MDFINDCSNRTLLVLQKYLNEKNIIIRSIEPYEGLDNKYYGDLKVLTINLSGESSRINVDFKKQYKWLPYIPIELSFQKADETFDNWLFNDNINLVVVEMYNGDVYILDHTTMLLMAKSFNTEEVWATSIVYNKNPEMYKKERDYIDENLAKYNLRKLNYDWTISPDDVHIKGTFNYNKWGKTHSGFCLQIPIRYLENFKVGV